MATIIVFSENAEIAAGLISYARGLASDVEAVTVGAGAAQNLIRYGASKVLALDETPYPECYAKAFAQWVEGQKPALLLIGSTTTGREIAAVAASCLDAAMISEATEVDLSDDGSRVSSILYGGLVNRTERVAGLAVVTLAANSLNAEKVDGESAIEQLNLEPDDRVSFISEEAIPKTGVDLSAAKRVVGIGMGCDEGDVQVAEEIAGCMEGELACSRSIAEQLHWLPLDRYIGISGAVIAPDLYLALGISGQVQHVFGARDSKVIAAINKDEKAPIFDVADYAIVGDIHAFMPLLQEKLRTIGEQRKG